MSERTLVTAAEVARLAGVGRAAVSNWRRRYGDFPRPAGGTDTSPTFRLSEVRRWLAEQGKTTSMSGVDLVWHELDSLPGETATILARAGDHLAGRVTRPPLPDEIRAALDDLAAEIGAENAFERLIRRFVEAYSRQLAVTAPALAELMVELAEITQGALADPACGTGSLLRAAPSGVLVQGQELDTGLGALARTRLGFRDGPHVVHVGDSLRANALGQSTADAVVCNPPFNVRHWGFDDLQYDGRWVYGLPPRGESELAWVQHCLALLRPGGRAVLLLPPGVAARRSGRGIRAELLRRGVLRAVVALPAGAASPLSLSMHLWVLEQPGVRPAGDDLLLVDAAAGGPARIDDIGWPEVHARIRRAVHGERDEGVSRTVPVIELLDDDVDVSPARHLRSPQLDVAGLDTGRRRLRELVTELGDLVPGEVVAAGRAAPRAFVTLGELTRSGALLLRQHGGRLPTVPDGPGVPVLTARDVATGRPPGERLPAGEVEPLDSIRLQAGDVIVPLVASRPAATVMEEPGALLGPHLYLLRPDPARLDPWFLAGFLRSSTTLRSAASLSGTYRLDIRRTEVPRIPLEEQRRFGEAFRQLVTFQQLLEHGAALGHEVTQALLDGIAAGVVEPCATQRQRPATRSENGDMEDES